LLVPSTLNELHAHRVSDGNRIATASVPTHSSFLAADPRSDRVYASVEGGVIAFRWNGASQALEPAGSVEGVTTINRPLAVVNDAVQDRSFLVVAKQGEASLAGVFHT